jgi:poly-gamma-glutamate synthesis protein (capsule biosynthesis protein)
MQRRTRFTARPAIHRSPVASDQLSGRTVRLVFFGDLMCMPGDRVPEVSPDLRALIEAADFVIGNCEAPVTAELPRSSARYAFTFRMAERYLQQFLERLGAAPDRCALSVANNHAGDQGPAGLEQTLECLARLGVTPVGARTRAGPATVLDVAGLRIAVKAWTHWMNREAFAPDSGPWRPGDLDRLAASGEGKAPGADFRIGLPHWDHEFCHYPCAATRERALRCLDSGFDLLVGHHPHVLQPIEWVGHGVCAYSLGNLNGPPLLLRSAPSRLLGVLEVELGAAATFRAAVDTAPDVALRMYRLRPFVQECHGSGVRLVPLAAAAPRLRHRLERRLGRLFPDLREGATG